MLYRVKKWHFATIHTTERLAWAVTLTLIRSFQRNKNTQTKQHNMQKTLLMGATVLALGFAACKKNEASTDADLHFRVHFDATQERLNNIGQPSPLPAGHAAQTPDFKQMSIHYIELAPNALTALGKGAIVYKAEENTTGGSTAVDFDKAAKAGQDEVLATISLRDVAPGTYEWVRASVTYQNYDVKFNIRNVPVVGDLNQQSGTIASFVGFNTYITSITPRTMKLDVNDDKRQGFWAFETNLSAPYSTYNSLRSGSAPEGSTTVVNPLFASSPIPAGSCVVTGKLVEPLVVTGTEKEDVTVRLSFSINQSFEWMDPNGNNQLDIYADNPANSEQIVDMGLRGLIPKVEQ
jgi:hypothetical protein